MSLTVDERRIAARRAWNYPPGHGHDFFWLAPAVRPYAFARMSEEHELIPPEPDILIKHPELEPFG